MPRARLTLLDEIERGALDDSAPLASVLRKCVALGGATRSAELRDWASRELHGYNGTELPAYRTVHAPLQADGWNARFRIQGQQISTFDLPDFAREHITNDVPLAGGVGELEALIRNAERDGETAVRLQPFMAAELVAYMNQQQGGGIERIYWSVSTSRIAGTLDQIRTTLVRLVSEMRATMSQDATMPTPDDAASAFNVVVNGGERNTITITATGRDSIAVAAAAPKSESGWTKASTIWTIISVLIATVGLYVAYRQWRG
ncbi:hypothetical protein AB0B31_15090 [Catellatospora citrea]|uniref:AbiTii domain-containing protein n=1 Tax=Catellatospora citrea TaxID=53366 RepID=UPI0033FD7685